MCIRLDHGRGTSLVYDSNLACCSQQKPPSSFCFVFQLLEVFSVVSFGDVLAPTLGSPFPC